MKAILNKRKSLKDNTKGQVFLVCTVIIIIYMLSFISIVYELNQNQYNRTSDINKFTASYNNFKTETDSFITSLIANYTQPGSIIVTNATAGQIIQNWLDFAEEQMIQKGYVAIFEINQYISPAIPVELVTTNGRIGFRGNIDVYMKSNYMSIDVQFSYNCNFTLSYVNTATSALIQFTHQTVYSENFIGYAEVTVNAGLTINLYNGTYLFGAPLVSGDTVVGTTENQIIVNLDI
ncbi:MAG: hypothetical protein JXA54_16810 [Candidatus Heimdallarchaeota archaeon]|nr:hypothetical protein [Candidatus Heimdallarchaeota archaeon]